MYYSMYFLFSLMFFVDEKGFGGDILPQKVKTSFGFDLFLHPNKEFLILQEHLVSKICFCYNME